MPLHLGGFDNSKRLDNGFVLLWTVNKVGQPQVSGTAPVTAADARMLCCRYRNPGPLVPTTPFPWSPLPF